MDSDGRRNTVKVAEKISTTCSPSSDERSPLTSSSSSSSVHELAAITDHYRATGRLRRENRSQAEKESGQTLVQHLTNSLSAKLKKLELVKIEHHRSSVITRTPPNSPKPHRTSTPSYSSSQLYPPIPPRNCQSLGPIVPPENRPHSPTCSEISSIGGEVFDEPGLVVHQQISVNKELAPEKPVPPSILITNTMDAAEKLVNSKIRKLNFRMRNYLPIHLTAGTVDYHKSKMDETEAVLLDVLESMDEMCVEQESELQLVGRLARWKTHILTIEREFSDYTLKFSPVLETLKNNSSPSGSVAVSNDFYQQEQLKLLKEKNEISKRNLDVATSESMREIDLKKAVAVRKFKAKTESILDDVEVLGEEVNKVGDWTEEVDLEISKAMRNVAVWKRKLEEIIKMERELLELVAENDLSASDVDLAETEEMVNNLKSEVKRATEEIISEDKARELYTLDTAIVDKIKLPMFEGKDEEDFVKFKELMKKAFVHNRISKCDKIAKLRESLRGYAKRLVPLSITNIDVAWEALNNAFGESDRLMRHKLAALDKLGELPRENGKNGNRGMVEWYLEIEGLLKSILDLGCQTVAMDREAFSNTALRRICNMFPSHIATKLNKCAGEGGTKLENMIGKISELRADAQGLELIREANHPAGTHGGDSTGTRADGARGNGSSNSSRRDGGYGGGRSWNKNDSKPKALPTFEMPTLTVYNPPRRDESCRVCNALEAKGDNNQLYDGHVNSFPTGCPRYMALSVEQRFEVAFLAHLCVKCHDPEYIHKFKDKDHNCVVKGSKKSRYTCSEPGCLFHMWICKRHKDQNAKYLKKFQEEIRTKFKLDFGYVVTCPVTPVSGSEVNAFEVPSSTKLKPKKSNITKPFFTKALNKAVNALNKKNVDLDDVVNLHNESVDTSDDIVDLHSETDLHSAANCNHKKLKSLSTDQALSKMKIKLTEEGVNEELRPIAKGRA